MMWRFAHLFLFLPGGAFFVVVGVGVRRYGRVFGKEENDNDNDDDAGLGKRMMGWRGVCTWRDTSPESSVQLSCGGVSCSTFHRSLLSIAAFPHAGDFLQLSSASHHRI